ncbi:MAG: hypothetical protein K2K39_01280, partial [Clostridia bacterium]|nr:hypothetical protein [Clostridia bacterium]
AHTHKFAEGWVSDKDNHWHAATCEHTDEKDGTATHTFPETWVTDTEATEEAEGSKHRDCTVCAYRQTGTISQLAHTHKFAEGWVSDKDNHWHAATCEHTTEKSGEAAHTWNDGTVTTPATCEEAGVKTLTCTVCQATKTESIPATSHSFSSAWESDASNHWHICANECGEKSENAGHDWGEPTVTKQPTEEEEGSQTVKCTVCQYEKTETVPTLGHTHKFADGWASDEDNHWHASTCGHDVKDSNAAHEWNDGEITTPASCTEEGVKTYACTVCGKTRTESVDKIAHDLESHEAKTPTCTEKGWDEYVTCKNCDYTTKTELPALGHDWATEWSKDETNHRHECSRCDEVNDEAAHGFKWEITKQPTKDEKGLKKNICTVCGYVGGEEEIAKLVSDDDGNGDVIDLPPDKEYDLEILVKATNAKYNVDGVNVGYEVALWIIVDGERAMEYDSSKTVTLMLRVPDEMKGKDFELYKVDGIKLSPIEDYEVDGSVVTVRTTLSAEIVFHTEKAPEKSGIPWWVWLIVGMGGVLAVCVIVITVVVIKKKSGNVTVVSNNGEVLKRLGKQDEKIDKLIEITDGGFNDTYNGD